MKTTISFFLILISFSISKKSQNLKKRVRPKEIKKEEKKSKIKFSLFYTTNITCTNLNCPSPNFCNDLHNICYCSKGYVNNPNEKFSETFCSYKQFKQLNSFLWELFTNFGIGHIIIGNFNIGMIKIVLNIILFILSGLVFKNYHSNDELKNDNQLGIKFTIFVYLCFLSSFIWWIVDLFSFGFNKYHDINNVPLMRW